MRLDIAIYFLNPVFYLKEEKNSSTEIGKKTEIKLPNWSCLMIGRAGNGVFLIHKVMFVQYFVIFRNVCC